MKRFTLSLAFLFVLLLGTITPTVSQAARPNPPTVAGTVPATMFVTEPGGTNLVVAPPRVLVIDERGNTVADVETTVIGFTGTFNIPLKKAGTYMVVGYYPSPVPGQNPITTLPAVAEVLRKQTSTVDLTWQPL